MVRKCLPAVWKMNSIIEPFSIVGHFTSQKLNPAVFRSEVFFRAEIFREKGMRINPSVPHINKPLLDVNFANKMISRFHQQHMCINNFQWKNWRYEIQPLKQPEGTLIIMFGFTVDLKKYILHKVTTCHCKYGLITLYCVLWLDVTRRLYFLITL